AKIINTVLTSIVPNFWSSSDREIRDLLRSSLSTVGAISAIISSIQGLIIQLEAKRESQDTAKCSDLISVLSEVLKRDSSIHSIWTSLRTSSPSAVQLDLVWKQFANIIGSGKVLSVVAEAEDALPDTSLDKQHRWLAAGSEYAGWLGRSIAYFAIKEHVSKDASTSQALSQLLTRALTIGHALPFITALHTTLLRHAAEPVSTTGTSLRYTAQYLPTHSRRAFLEHTLRWLATLLSHHDADHIVSASSAQDVSAAAYLLDVLVADDETLRRYLMTFSTDPATSSSFPFTIRRAVLAVISREEDDALHTVFEDILRNFSDPLFIKHAPTVQQESMAQTLLVAAGYIHRATPVGLLTLVRASGHMQGVSNRLDASNDRGRWLGMIVGTALSGLVDKEGMTMNFGTDDMRTAEAHWYLDLIKVDDDLGSREALLKLTKQDAVARRPRQKHDKRITSLPVIDGKPTFGPLRPPQAPVQTEVEGAKVTEILDSSSDADNDLNPYAKPDSDPEDSDEDATLVNRNKTRPPVYSRDLMTMLRDTENHGPFTLGLQHAAGLIRRKIGFGKEVSDHAAELARVLCSLQDAFDTDDFDELKLQALIAVVMSSPTTIAPWLGRQAFVGEYSIAQRCVMLIALGLSGRELAGLQEPDELNPVSSKPSFPSKQLPSHLHSIYTPSNRRLEAAHTSLEKSLIAPLALQAADQSTAHLNAVKVRTFSSRMETARTKRKAPPNGLAKIFAQCYFTPLIRSYQQDVAAYGSGSLWVSTPFLLVTLLKTLALLLHASGPATLALRDVTEEFWQMLLALRVQALGDITVLEAVLFGFLTLLEVNTNKQQLADEFSKQLMETRDWVDMVFERTGASGLVDQEGTGEEAKVRTLAAGVLVRAGEIMEASRAAFMGGMSDF
ncbi:telomere binding protein, partial [Oleoguttula sp. CCFEE 5521]